MPNLHSQLNDLATSFANSVFDAIKGASLEQLLGDGGGIVGRDRPARTDGPRAFASARLARKAVVQASAAPTHKAGSKGRLPRRSAEDIAKLLAQVAALVNKHKDGLRAEEIRANLGMQAKEMPRILKEGIAKKVLKTKGQKRATTYFGK